MKINRQEAFPQLPDNTQKYLQRYFWGNGKNEQQVKDLSEAWAPYISGEIEICPIPCQHGDMLLDRDPSAQIGQALAAELSKLNQRRK
jgi:hypothetical protein